MLYLKLVPNEFRNASHDKRELSVAENLGYKILVVATTKEQRNYNDFYDGYNVYRISTRRLGKSRWLNIPNRILAFIDFVLFAIKIDADIISGHNYIATLMGYISNLFKKNKAKLIYDSHEFELYTIAPTNSLFLKMITKIIEGYLLRRTDLNLMVGDKIADGVQEIYHLKKRPTVVRNIAPLWDINREKSIAIRKDIMHSLNMEKVDFLLMYHGGIEKNRGIEYAIRSLPLLENDVGLIIMGREGSPGIIDSFKQLAVELKVDNRVLFKDPVPLDDLKDYIGSVDVELVLQNAPYLGMLYSLPNKFFESIQACMPLICCDLPEMGNIVRQYDIGLLVNENDEASVANAVLKLRNDKNLYVRIKQNMEKAKKELCWEQEGLKLKKAIQRMMGERTDAI